MTSARPRVHGLLLAAGSGSRMGRPKALVRDPDGQAWLRRSVQVLLDGGCAGVTVVLGATVDPALDLLADLDDLREEVATVVAEDWDEGMGASLRAGLAAVAQEEARTEDAVLVHLVDLPDVGADVVHRVLAAPVGPTTLRRAVYDGLPGHPVLLGRAHWAEITRTATGDRGARDHLAAHPPEEVECGDLAGGRDVDRQGPE